MKDSHDVLDMPLYGEYNWQDPIYKVLRRETASPRFKLYMLKHGMINILFYQYTDMKALHTRGGVDFDDLMRRQRRVLVDEGIVTEANEKMKQTYSEEAAPYLDLETVDFRRGNVWCG